VGWRAADRRRASRGSRSQFGPIRASPPVKIQTEKERLELGFSLKILHIPLQGKLSVLLLKSAHICKVSQFGAADDGYQDKMLTVTLIIGFGAKFTSFLCIVKINMHYCER